MNRIFIPYAGSSVAAVSIKGHRFVVLSRRKDKLERSLHLLGADSLRELHSAPGQEEAALGVLAREVRGGLVIAPAAMELPDVLRLLESQLTWIH